MPISLPRHGIALTGVAFIAACGAPSGELSGARVSVTPRERVPEPAAAAPERPSVALAPSFTRSLSADGLATAQFVIRLVDEQPQAPGLRLLALPTTWTGATVTLFSPSANTAFDQATHKLSLTFAGAGATKTASGAIGALRPATDYRAEVTLQNSQGDIVTPRLAGSATKLQTLDAGSNTVAWTVTVNGQEGTYQEAHATSASSLSTLSYEDGTVSTFAGGTLGTADGVGTAAQFGEVKGVTVSSAGTVYVADNGNNLIRKVAPDGTVSQHALSAVSAPHGLCLDASGNLYVAEAGAHKIRKVDPAGAVTTVAGSTGGWVDGAVAGAKFKSPKDVRIDAAGALYVADNGNELVRKIAGGTVSTLAGMLLTPGYQDGPAASAKFSDLYGVLPLANGDLVLGEIVGARLRRLSNGVVSTFAGSGAGAFADGQGTAASFKSPRQLAADEAGNLYVADYSNHRIRRISPTGYVTTIAGTGTSGLLNGPAASARFNAPYALAFGPDKALYIADMLNYGIRKLVPRSGYFTKGDQLTIKTGLQNGQPAVDHLDVKLSGACYGSPGSPVLVKRFTSAEAAGWDTWLWDTSADNTVSSATYTAATLAAGASGTTPQDGQLDFEAYDRYGLLVGKASLGIRVFGSAGLTVRVR